MNKNKSKYLREQEPKIEEKNQKKGEAMYRAILVIAISLVLFILVGMLF